MKQFNFLKQSLSYSRKEDVLNQIEQGSSPGIDYFFLIILSAIIATLGLITNSAAVIIGAMLVAPLMSPIMGLSLASVVGEDRVFRKALFALIEGTLLSIILSASVSLLSKSLPFGALSILPLEIMSRTRPTPFDLGIALAGGAAAAYALAQPKLSAALPGVAISTALMPPLCTVGIGIAVSDPQVTFGSLLLFLTNFAAISFSGILTFIWLGFRPLNINKRWQGIPQSFIISLILVLIISIPLVFLTLRSVQNANFATQLQEIVTKELENLPGAQFEEMQFLDTNESIEIELSILLPYQPSYEQVVALQSSLASQLNRSIGLKLVVIPATELDPLIPPTHTPTLTIGPSVTPTTTSTPTSTMTISPSPTQTFTATSTNTNTPTFTPTPVLARISNVNGAFIYLRDLPNGSISFSLPPGSYVQLMDGRETIDNILWIEIRDIFNRIAWLPAQYLQIQP
ncbi:MAG: DUF389 domain-containing protein [Anaerolineaceae bacterium]|nr:DUF389 domain-containing protein [Anaerolineaceae bacterium]